MEISKINLDTHQVNTFKRELGEEGWGKMAFKLRPKGRGRKGFCGHKRHKGSKVSAGESQVQSKKLYILLSMRPSEKCPVFLLFKNLHVYARAHVFICVSAGPCVS